MSATEQLLLTSQRGLPAWPEPAQADLPAAVHRAPEPGVLWMRALYAAEIILAWFFLDRLALLLMDYWLLDSLGLSSVFWTNFKMGALLFVASFVIGMGMIGPALASGVSPAVRRFVVHAATVENLIAGWYFSTEYHTFLGFWYRQPFGEIDPYFGYDLSFYIFDIPAFWDIWWFKVTGLLGLVATSIGCAYLSRPERKKPSGFNRVTTLLGDFGTWYTRFAVVALAYVLAAGWMLARYDMLWRKNPDPYFKGVAHGYTYNQLAAKGSGVFAGPTYVDFNGVISTLNNYHVAAFVTFAVGTLLALILGHLHRAVNGTAVPDWTRRVRRYCWASGGLVALALIFPVLITARHALFISPNQPVIQLPYLQRHIDYTRKAFELDKVETVRFVPKTGNDPLPSAEELLATPTMRNLTLWPGHVSWMEPMVDQQHTKRIFQTDGDTMVYGPTKQLLQQQQQYRLYYNFLDVDTVRYKIDGEKRLVISSVREIPLNEPMPWLAWWGQENLLFTHGWGIVTALPGDLDKEGEPNWLDTGSINDDSKLFGKKNERVYYGEGSGSMAYTNIRGMKELDRATEEGRAEYVLPKEVKAGVNMDSLLKRLVYGYKSNQLLEILFSEMIDGETRVHFYRPPLERLDRIAPFLYYDSDPWAVYTKDGIVWMVNGITTTGKYLHSQGDFLGDKSAVHTPFPRKHRWMNYLRDAVKITVDAYSGQVSMYKWADEPIINTWAVVYPELFKPKEAMPKEVREQVQYPYQMFHTQFDDIYYIYQQKDPMTFFNMEDIWDDGDEVLGPYIDKGEAITFSVEPYHWMIDTGDIFPQAKEKVQFALSQPFCAEHALNIRGLPTVYMDGDDYGRLVCLNIPKGNWFYGPEQADALIDQRPEISQQFAWWTRQGHEVIRGHTLGVVVKGELIYVEPIFLKSAQNKYPQLKKVCVVLRGHARMGDTLEEALRLVLEAAATSPVAPPPAVKPAPKGEKPEAKKD